MNLQVSKLFFLMAALLLLVACGGAAEPEVDIEATAETRTQATVQAVPSLVLLARLIKVALTTLRIIDALITS